MYKIAVMGDMDSVLGFKALGLEVCPVADDRIDAITGARILWKLCGQTLKSNETPK